MGMIQIVNFITKGDVETSLNIELKASKTDNAEMYQKENVTAYLSKNVNGLQLKIAILFKKKIVTKHLRGNALKNIVKFREMKADECQSFLVSILKEIGKSKMVLESDQE